MTNGEIVEDLYLRYRSKIYGYLYNHLRSRENAEDLLEVFETVKALSKVCASPYKYVRDWFETQFPDYQTVPVFKDNKLTILPVPAPEVKEYKKKLA